MATMASMYQEYMSIASFFYDMYIETYKEEVRIKEFCEIEGKNKNDEWIEENISDRLYEQDNNRNYYTYALFLFEAIAIESYINYFGALKLGAAYYKEHLDNLDLVSKYVIVYRLVFGKKFPKNLHTYGKLLTLKEIRNKIVHDKSFPVDFEKPETALATVKKLFFHKDKSIKNLMLDVHGLCKELIGLLEGTNN